MDSGNFLPPTQLPKNIMNNYSAMESVERVEDFPDDTITDNSFFMKHGGKTLAVLIAISAIIFLILFYDSIHIENKLMANTPDKLQLLLDKFNIKVPIQND